jgi:hypothetical protein
MYQTAKATFQRPSDLAFITDRWAALQFDNAVTFFGLGIESALSKMENIGDDTKPKWVARYTLGQLLEPDFRLPLDDDGADIDDMIDLFKTSDGAFYDEVG